MSLTFSDEQIKSWMGRVRHLCCRWRSHPQFDDIVATAYLGMWEALRRADDTPGRDHTALALSGAYCGALKFIRSPVNVTSTVTQRGHERAEVLSLSDWQSLWCRSGAIPPTAEPDFAPRLIEWIAANQELAKLPPKKRQALILGCIYELSRKEIIDVTGWKRDFVYKMLAGTEGIPTLYGNPAYGDR